MALYDNAGRIPRQAADGSLVALFIIAILSASGRFLVRLHYQRRLFWDDAMLGFAILLLTTCLGLWFSFADDMYLAESVMLGEFTADMNLAEIIPKSLRLHRLSDVALVLSWTSLNAVKLSFVLFFGTLCNRASRLRWYWIAVLCFTVVTWMAGLPLEVVACPYFDERALTCASGDKYAKTIAIAAALISINIISDLLIFSVPVIILNRITVPLKTKIYLGMSLCLSVMTIGITLVRVSGLKVPGMRTVDVVWQVYWQYVEVCIGIMVVSATAFRTFFVQRAARNSDRRSTPRSYFGQRFRQKFLNKSDASSNENLGLPEHFPGATMTGMRTYIDGNGKTHMASTLASSAGSRDSEEKDDLRTPEQAYSRV